MGLPGVRRRVPKTEVSASKAFGASGRDAKTGVSVALVAAIPILYTLSWGPVPIWWIRALRMSLFPTLLAGMLVGWLGIRYKDLARGVEEQWIGEQATPPAHPLEFEIGGARLELEDSRAGWLSQEDSTG